MARAFGTARAKHVRGFDSREDRWGRNRRRQGHFETLWDDGMQESLFVCVFFFFFIFFFWGGGGGGVPKIGLP